jgi:hypothetical protein
MNFFQNLEMKKWMYLQYLEKIKKRLCLAVYFHLYKKNNIINTWEKN